eukprot:309523_1
MAEEKKESNVLPSKYSLSVSVVDNQLAMSVRDTITKQVYESKFDAEQLKQCGYSGKQVSNLQGMVKYIEAAKAAQNDLQLTVSIEKDTSVVDDMKQIKNEGVHAIVDTGKPQPQSKASFYCVITITSGKMEFVMKLAQIPRQQSEINKEYIKDLQNEIIKLKQGFQTQVIQQEYNKKTTWMYEY